MQLLQFWTPACKKSSNLRTPETGKKTPTRGVLFKVVDIGSFFELVPFLLRNGCLLCTLWVEGFWSQPFTADADEGHLNTQQSTLMANMLSKHNQLYLNLLQIWQRSIDDKMKTDFEHTGSHSHQVHLLPIFLSKGRNKGLTVWALYKSQKKKLTRRRPRTS